MNPNYRNYRNYRNPKGGDREEPRRTTHMYKYKKNDFTYAVIALIALIRPTYREINESEHNCGGWRVRHEEREQ